MQTKSLSISIWLINAVLVFLALGIFCLASQYYYYAYSLNDTFKIELVDLNLQECYAQWMVNSKIALLIVANILAFYIFWNLRKLLGSFKTKSPFSNSSLERLKKISRAFVIFFIVYITASCFVGFIAGDLNIIIDTSFFVMLFLVFFVFSIVEVFQYGGAIYNDQKFTI